MALHIPAIYPYLILERFEIKLFPLENTVNTKYVTE